MQVTWADFLADALALAVPSILRTMPKNIVDDTMRQLLRQLHRLTYTETGELAWFRRAMPLQYLRLPAAWYQSNVYPGVINAFRYTWSQGEWSDTVGNALKTLWHELPSALLDTQAIWSTIARRQILQAEVFSGPMKALEAYRPVSYRRGTAWWSDRGGQGGLKGKGPDGQMGPDQGRGRAGKR